MRSLFISALQATALAAVVHPPRISYDGVKVIRLDVGGDVDRVERLAARLKLQMWKGPNGADGLADFAVRPENLGAFYREAGDLNPVVMHEDLGASIAEESAYEVYAAGSANSSWFNSYHVFADHVQFLKDLQAQHPNNSEIVSSGKSYLGNDIPGIRIFGARGAGKNPAVVFHGTVHAREWIATMVVEYLAYALLTGQGAGYPDRFDFIFFPVVNPDGFIHTQTTDRMWRKNRQPTSGSGCLGHDVNRNWAYKWDEAGGASTNPCAEDFKGSSAGDTPEFKALSGFLKKTKESQGLKLFIDYHAYSQLFMTPYGYACNVLPKSNDEYQSLAKGAVDAIFRVHGVSFESGPICSTIYPASGSSVDYVTDVVQADYAFTSELRDTGRNGFVLPVNQILPSGEEALAGVKYLLDNMRSKGLKVLNQICRIGRMAGKSFITLPLLAVFLAYWYTSYLQRPVQVMGYFRTPNSTLVAPGNFAVIEGTICCEDLHYWEASEEIFTACESNLGTRVGWFPPVGHLNLTPGYEARLDGRLQVIDVKTRKSRTLLLEDFDGPFATHGIDVIPDPEAAEEAVYIFAVNHLPNPEHWGPAGDKSTPKARSVIEVFHHVLGSDVAKHVRRVWDEKIATPNDVLAMSPTAFFVTNDHRHREGRMRTVEDVYWRARWTQTYYVETGPEKTKASVALEGVHYNNGLGRGRTPEEIAVVEAARGRLNIGKVRGGKIDIVRSVELESTLDNPAYFSDPYADEKLDASGWVNCGHATGYMAHANKAKEGDVLEPIMVWKTSGETTKLLFEDDGRRIRTCSTAVLVAIDPKEEGGRRRGWLYVTGYWSSNTIAVKIDL